MKDRLDPYEGRDRVGESGWPEGGRGAMGQAEGHPAARGEVAGIVLDGVELLDSFFDYFAAKFRLERYRIESQTRRLILRIALVLGSAVVLLIGLIFVSVGVADLIGQGLGSPAAGRLIVGGFYLLSGVVALIVAKRRGSKPHVERQASRQAEERRS